MRIFCITLLGNNVSEDMGIRCCKTANAFNIDVELFSATPRYYSTRLFEELGLIKNLPSGIRKSKSPDFKGGNNNGIHEQHLWLSDAEAGCFMSHYRLWAMCAAIGEPIIILEHDAIFNNTIPTLPDMDSYDIINISKHNIYRLVDDKTTSSINLPNGYSESPQVNWTYGSHAYVVSPQGARKLINEAHSNRIWPSDMFIKSTFLKRLFYYPYFVELQADRANSTIEG